MARTNRSTIGSWAFLIGVILAVILGLFGSVTGGVAWLLVVLGIIVGLLNITEKETQSFLLAGTVLVVIAFMSGDIFSTLKIGAGSSLGTVFDAIMTLFVPATAIVALKHVFTLARA